MAQEAPQRFRCACDPTRTFVSEETYWLHRRKAHHDALPEHIAARIEARGGNRPAESPRAERVPPTAVGLPWIKYPRDAGVCESIVAGIDAVARRAASDGEKVFWTSLRRVMETIADRLRTA